MAVFFFCVVIRFSVLTEEIDFLISDQLRDQYTFDILLVTIGMLGSITAALFLTVVMAAQQLIVAAQVPTIRLQARHVRWEGLALLSIFHRFIP